MLKTKPEIFAEIEALEQLMHRSCVATANMAELRRDDLWEIARSMRADQLADCGHLFWND